MIIEPKTWKPKGARSGRPRFRGLVQYMLRGKGTQRCTWFMAGNLDGLNQREDAETAIKVVEAYQRRNTRAKRDKTYHLVISLHPDDRSLGARELERVVRRAVEAAGLGEHHYIAVRHSDQEHEHLHVAVSRIHPKTLKIHHPWKDIAKFKALASELEQDLGLHRVDRSTDKERTGWGYASRQFESARGEQSFTRWARTRIGEAFDLARIADWQELHTHLAAHGVRLVPRGNGLAVVDATRDSLHCKASALGRQWSKQKLTERFGTFKRGPSAERVARAQREPYEPTPLERLRHDGLWHEYQDALGAARTRREEQRGALSFKVDSARAAHRRRFKLRHHAIAAMPIAGREKQKLYKMLSIERKAAERKLQATVKRWRTMSVDTHPGSWKEFLSGRAARGDQRAVRRLKRQLQGLTIKSRDNRLPALLSPNFRTSRGSIVHNLPGGVRLRESAGSIELLGEARDDALEQLVKVAKERFETKQVRLLGSRRAQKRLAELALEQGLEIAEERQR